MTDAPDHPQIYLITPPEIELSSFPDTLARCLDTTEVGCVRLSLATKDEDRIAKAADACRVVTHERDVALVIESHMLMVGRRQAGRVGAISMVVDDDRSPRRR